MTHPLTFWLLALLGLLSGATIAIQASTNAMLLSHVEKLIWVALALFVVGTVYLLGLILLTGIPTPNWQGFRTAPPWAYVGGIVVASYVLTITFLVPRIGAANAIIFVVAGQILTAVVIDHFGWFGVTIRELSWQRGLGVVLLLGGIYLSRK